MGEMGMGYGSECHLLRYLGRHRRALDARILEVEAIACRWPEVFSKAELATCRERLQPEAPRG